MPVKQKPRARDWAWIKHPSLGMLVGGSHEGIQNRARFKWNPWQHPAGRAARARAGGSVMAWEFNPSKIGPASPDIVRRLRSKLGTQRVFGLYRHGGLRGLRGRSRSAVRAILSAGHGVGG